MKLLPCYGVTLLLVLCGIASAQQPTAIIPAPLPPSEHYSNPNLSAPPVTPELWVYSQEMRRHDDPAQAVRRKAEVKADQRANRIAATKWYGLSNSRPHAWGAPMLGYHWIGWPFSTSVPYYATGVSSPATTVRVESFDALR